MFYNFLDFVYLLLWGFLSVCLSLSAPVCTVRYSSVSVTDYDKCPGAKNHSSVFPSLHFNRLVYCVNNILEFTRCFILTFDISLFA